MSKLIFVPPHNVQVDPPHSHAIKMGSNNLMIQTEMASIPSSLPRDPLDPYISHYLIDGMNRSDIVSKSSYMVDLNWGLDQKIIIEKWVNDSCRLPVIWQLGDNFGQSPKLLFLDGVLRKNQFVGMLTQFQTRLEKFRIPIRDDSDPLEISDWLRDHVDVEKYVMVCGVTEVFVQIRDQNAAMEFKLRWSENDVVHINPVKFAASTPVTNAYDDDVPF